MAALPAANARERKKLQGSIGSDAPRSSQTTNATTRSAPSASAAITSTLDQPAAFPRTRPQTIPNAPPLTSAKPGRSSAVSGPWLSSIRASTSGNATSPIGTLTQKIHSHERPWETAPPITGPPIVASPVTPSRIPIAVPRRSAGNDALTIDRASEITSAAPSPWTARAAIKTSTSADSAQPAEVSTNRPRLPAKSRRRPNRSPSTAAGSRNTARLRL